MEKLWTKLEPISMHIRGNPAKRTMKCSERHHGIVRARALRRARASRKVKDRRKEKDVGRTKADQHVHEHDYRTYNSCGQTDCVTPTSPPSGRWTPLVAAQVARSFVVKWRILSPEVSQVMGSQLRGLLQLVKDHDILEQTFLWCTSDCQRAWSRVLCAASSAHSP